MSTYTAENGSTHPICPGFENGDVVLMSDEGTVFWVDRALLTDASPCFRDMLGDKNLTASPIPIPATARTLHILLDALDDSTLRAINDWESVILIIELVRKYFTDSLACEILYQSSKFIQSFRRVEAFVIAAELDHLPSGLAIISMQPIELAQFEPGARPYGFDMNSMLWTRELLLRGAKTAWTWALKAAFRKTWNIHGLSEEKNGTSVEFWNFILVYFVKGVRECHSVAPSRKLVTKQYQNVDSAAWEYETGPAGSAIYK